MTTRAPHVAGPIECVGTCSGNAYFEMISPIYSRYRPPSAESTGRELSLLSAEWSRRSQGHDPGRALDLMCGRGRHSLGLAERGWSVVGVDIDPQFLGHVRMESVRRDLDIRTVVGDVHRLPVRGPFDLVMSLGTSFGVGAGSAAHALNLLRHVSTLLRSEGVIAIEMFDPLRRYERGTKERIHEVPGVGTLRKFSTWDPVKEVEHVVGRVDWASPVSEACYVQFVPTDSTMTELLIRAGFRDITQSVATLGWTSDDSRLYVASRPGRMR